MGIAIATPECRKRAVQPVPEREFYKVPAGPPPHPGIIPGGQGLKCLLLEMPAGRTGFDP